MTNVMTTAEKPPVPPRDRMVRSATTLLRERGVHGVGMREVVEHAEAPRGSLQHYFPGGKIQLMTEALGLGGRWAVRQVRRAAESGATPEQMLRAVFDGYRADLVRHGFAYGCPVAAVVVDTAAGDDTTLRDAAHDAFVTWENAMADVLAAHGRTPEQAAALATLLVAAVEGALVLARAARSTGPLDTVEAELHDLVRYRRSG